MRLEGGPADAIEVLDAPPVPGLTFRSYRGEEDLPLFKEVFDGCKEVDQIWWSMTIEEYVNEFRHLVGCDPERDIVVAEVDGRVVGYSKMRMYVERDGTVRYMHNAFVLPAFRGVGIRRAFLRHHHQRARELVAGHEGKGPHRMSTWVTKPEEDRRGMLKSEGYTPARYFYEMLRDLDEPIPDLPLPEGIEVRPVPPGDHRKVFDSINEALRDHWGSREMGDEEFERFINNPSCDPDLWQVAYDGDEVAGTVINWIIEAENEEFDRRWGYTEEITVQGRHRGRGLAKGLIARSLRMLRDRGMEQANLGVDTENPSGALGLYTGLGYRPVKEWMIWDRPVE